MEDKKVQKFLNGINPELSWNGDLPDLLTQRIFTLNLEEKAELLSNYPKAVGNLLHDPGSIFSAEISIDDSSTNEREKVPLAYVTFSGDYGTSRIEVVDLIESVKREALAVAHPVVAAAVRRWQRIIRTSAYLETKTAYDKAISKAIQQSPIKEYRRPRFAAIARMNLERIRDAFAKGRRGEQMPAPNALIQKISELPYDAENTYLRAAWRRLERKLINETHEIDNRISEIESYLRKLPTAQTIDWEEYLDKPELFPDDLVDITIGIHHVLDFLRGPGSRYVYHEKNATRRPNWVTFRNTFLEWYFNIGKTTLRNYIKFARKTPWNSDLDVPLFPGPERSGSVLSELKASLSIPLVRFCPPFEIRGTQIDLSEIAAHIGVRTI